VVVIEVPMETIAPNHSQHFFIASQSQREDYMTTQVEETVLHNALEPIRGNEGAIWEISPEAA
jgi:hypothetical protein